MARSTSALGAWSLLLSLSCGPGSACVDDDTAECRYPWVLLGDSYYRGGEWSGAGSSLAVGDLDDDGTDEVLVGLQCQYPDDCGNLGYTNTELSGAYLLDAPFEGGRLDDVAFAYFGTRTARSSRFGAELAITGDITGDDLSDVVIWGGTENDEGPNEFDWYVFSGPFEEGSDVLPGDATAVVADESRPSECGTGCSSAVSCLGDEDGNADICTTDGVVIGPLSGEYGQEEMCMGIEGRMVAVGDLDGDDVEELVFSQREVLLDGGPTISVVPLGEPCNEIDPITDAEIVWTVPNLEEHEKLIVAGDLDGDGLDDVVYAESVWDEDDDVTQPTVFLLAGSEGGPVEEEYATFIPRNIGERKMSLASGDFDGDGQEDLAYGVDSAWVIVHRGPIGPGVHTEQDADAILTVCDENTCNDIGGCYDEDEYFAYSLAAGDLDGDGRDDLVIGAPQMEEDGLEDSGRVYIAWGGGL